MAHTQAPTQEPPPGGPAADFEDLRREIEHAAHLLPAQGPITVFVHHNTMHAFEGLPFEQAVQEAPRTFGCQPYLSEDAYRQKLAEGRIRAEDLSAVLLEQLGDGADALVGFLGTRYRLRLAMLEHRLRFASDTELRWFVAEADALYKFSPEAPRPVRNRLIRETRRWAMRDLRDGPGPGAAAGRGAATGLFEKFGAAGIERWPEATWEAFCLHLLWRVCRAGVHGVDWPAEPGPAQLRHRHCLWEATGEDTDPAVHGVLIRFCAAFLDQGFAGWALPGRGLGLYRAFLGLYQRAHAPDPLLRGLGAELRRLAAAGTGPLESVAESLDLLGVGRGERQAFLTQALLALRGWAGMVWQLETRGDRAAFPAPPGTLVEFLAVRLVLERVALANAARAALGFRGPLRDLRGAAGRRGGREAPGHDQRAFMVFQLAQVLGWRPEDLARLTRAEWAALAREVAAFPPLERRRVYHLAFERQYRNQALDAVAARAGGAPVAAGGPPRFQVVCCIDDREESFRRHLEEVAPDCETFGAAGFFSVPMYYRGTEDAHFLPLCPVVVRPRHWVVEDVAYTFEAEHRRRTRTRRLLGAASRRFHLGSRSRAGGALAALVGSLASVPLVAQILFPRASAQIRRLFGGFVQPPPVRQLRLERSEPEPGPQGGNVGFLPEEMAAAVRRQLQDIGLTARFPRLVFFLGHGSSSLNNPHESAYNCGACAGGRGGPNARAFAQMANDHRVRALLAAGGLDVPHHTVFVGGYHNTCDDSVTYYDLDRVPLTHRADLTAAIAAIDRARERNAHERCRRFESAPLSLTPEAALRHVEARAEDLSQTRPEYNHATNALCVVGRRARTRGLFLDRRAFLASYDPAQDDGACSVLERILQAVVPVCAGISLEYYFSCVDPGGWGCGTKLPHNVTALLGVMDGAASDLRPGLSSQMVEIHEPVRLLCVVEAAPGAVLAVLARNPPIDRLCRNGWVQLAALDPGSPRLHLFRGGRFEPYTPESGGLPRAATSADWYRGWRGHLGFAAVGPAAAVAPAAGGAR